MADTEVEKVTQVEWSTVLARCRKKEINSPRRCAAQIGHGSGLLRLRMGVCFPQGTLNHHEGLNQKMLFSTGKEGS